MSCLLTLTPEEILNASDSPALSTASCNRTASSGPVMPLGVGMDGQLAWSLQIGIQSSMVLQILRGPPVTGVGPVDPVAPIPVEPPVDPVEPVDPDGPD